MGVVVDFYQATQIHFAASRSGFKLGIDVMSGVGANLVRLLQVVVLDQDLELTSHFRILFQRI